MCAWYFIHSTHWKCYSRKCTSSQPAPVWVSEGLLRVWTILLYKVPAATIEQHKGTINNMTLVTAAQMLDLFPVNAGAGSSAPLHRGDTMNASSKSQTLHQFYSFLHLKDNTQLPLCFFFLMIQLILPRDRDYLAYVSTSLNTAESRDLHN